MKINRGQLGDILLQASLSQYACVPAEDELNYTFSEEFEEKIRSLCSKSDSALWRTWNTPVKRVILIAVIVALMLITVACAVPVIREIFIREHVGISFVEHEDEGCYGITFDPVQAANAPRTLEEMYIPTYEPEGYELTIKIIEHYRVEYIWQNEEDEYISYDQIPFPENPTDDDWFKINAEATERTTLIVDGYQVEIVSSKERAQYVAIWTDNRYIYTIDISVFDEDPEPIFRELMSSLVQVQKNS